MRILRTDWLKTPTALETLIYFGLWLCIFALPLSLLSENFRFNDVLLFWGDLGGFFLFFLIHNFFIAPILVSKKRPTLYAVLALTLLISAQTLHTKFVMPYIMQHHERGPRHLPGDRAKDPARWQQAAGERQPPPGAEAPHGKDGKRFRPGGPRGMHGKGSKDLFFFGPREIFTFIYMILVIGLNLAVKLYFKTLKERGRVAELEKEMLEQQLTYLRFQINPHFFMNTLNNIFALVDIDPEGAKTSLMQLSKMMRYALYESTGRTVPLRLEVESVHHYLDLMRLRYTDNVRIDVELPDPLPDVPIPPLILVTFLENAFKHGISFSKPSFVHFKLEVQEHSLVFRFTNSVGAATQEEKGGIGLNNVRKRLDLIYGKDYSIVKEINDDVFRLTLTLPK
ncbi:MAG: sensor histidine kinase [Alloprevotella sp.]